MCYIIGETSLGVYLNMDRGMQPVFPELHVREATYPKHET